VLPNFSARQGDRLREQALEVASRIELARERAVLTGAHHRVVIDLDTGGFHIEWFVTESRAYRQPGDEDEEEGDDAGEIAEEAPDYSSARTPISLQPPESEKRDNYPIPSRFGAEAYLEPGYFFAGLDAPGGWVDEGAVYIVFEPDGTTDYSELVLGDEYENEVVLEVRPLLDQVRIRERDDDS
jgi:hypothetical protein